MYPPITDLSTGGANAGLSEKGDYLFAQYHLNYHDNIYSNFASKDVRQTCGFAPTCCCTNACRDKKARYKTCADAVTAYNLSALTAPPPLPPDTTGVGAPPPSGGGAPPPSTPPPSGGGAGKGGDVQKAGMMGGKTMIYVIVGIVLLVLIFLAYKKFSKKAE